MNEEQKEKLRASLNHVHEWPSLYMFLIVLLGVVMYLKLIKFLQKKRLSNSYSSIESYKKVKGKHIITYSAANNEDSEMVIESVSGDVLCNARINHEAAGEYNVTFQIPKVEGEFVNLLWKTNKQRIKKKIYLEI